MHALRHFAHRKSYSVEIGDFEKAVRGALHMANADGFCAYAGSTSHGLRLS